MAKYSKRMKDKIVSLTEEGIFSVSEICKILGIGRKAFYNWKVTKPDFAEELEEAIRCREERLTIKAHQALQKKLDGYTQVETKITYIPTSNDDDPSQLKIKEYVIKEKLRAPETSAIACALNNVNKESYKKASISKTSPDDLPLVITVSDEETRRNIELLQKRIA